MTAENRPQHLIQPGPPIEDEWEMSFAGTLSEAVETLFTYRPIVEKLQETPGDKTIDAFVQGWKLSMIRHLELAAQMAVGTFLAELERFQADHPASTTSSLDEDRDPLADDQAAAKT